MQWLDEVSFSCFNDAWMTCINHFKPVSAYDFIRACKSGKYICLTVAELRRLATRGKLRNISLDRLVKGRTDPYAAYPGSATDKESIDYLLRNPVSPIVIAKIRDKYILLDGMHRCVVASYLRPHKVNAILIRL